MRAKPLSTTLLKLVPWNITSISRGATGGDDADVIIDLVGSGRSGSRQFRFSSLVFRFRVVLHDNPDDEKTPPQPFPFIYISLLAVNYTWVSPDKSAFLAFPFRFYLNSKGPFPRHHHHNPVSLHSRRHCQQSSSLRRRTQVQPRPILGTPGSRFRATRSPQPPAIL